MEADSDTIRVVPRSQAPATVQKAKSGPKRTVARTRRHRRPSAKAASAAATPAGAAPCRKRPFSLADHTCCVLSNNGPRSRPDELTADQELLRAATTLFHAHLPKMTRRYIDGLVHDAAHYTLVIASKRRSRASGQGSTSAVVAATTFRPFPQHGFVEIAFYIVDARAQSRGYGGAMLQMLKDWIRAQYGRGGIGTFVTYADKDATGFFRKQGFTTMVGSGAGRRKQREIWDECIRHYDGARLMVCASEKHREKTARSDGQFGWQQVQ